MASGSLGPMGHGGLTRNIRKKKAWKSTSGNKTKCEILQELKESELVEELRAVCRPRHGVRGALPKAKEEHFSCPGCLIWSEVICAKGTWQSTEEVCTIRSRNSSWEKQ